jgi:hypothetical protein
MDITNTRVVARSRSPARCKSSQACTAKCGPKWCTRLRDSEQLLEIGSAQPAGCHRGMRYRSLRATNQPLDRIVLEFMESAEPCVGIATAHVHAQFGVSAHTTPHPHEEAGDE